MVRVHVVISGRVQGVWFRQSTEDRARQLGVTGWVRNLPDGRVEATAEGPQEAVEALVAFCRQGPPASRVVGVAVEWAAPTGEFSGFTTRR